MKEVEYYWVILDNEIKTIATPVREYDGLNWYMVGVDYPVDVKEVRSKVKTEEEDIALESQIMRNINISEDKTERMALKAKHWDDLGKIIESYYFDEDGNEIIEGYEDDTALLQIGEHAARAFGWPI
mgnify:CR=1 FL=1